MHRPDEPSGRAHARRLGAALLGLAILGGVLALSGTAAAAGSGTAPLAPVIAPDNDPGALRFLTPGNETLLTSHSLTVVLRAKRGVSAISLGLDGRRTIRLQRSAGGRLTGRVSRLGVGSHVLVARGRLANGRSTLAAAAFVVGRRTGSLLRVTAPRRVSGARPVTAELHLRGEVQTIDASLNGKSADSSLVTVRAARRTLQLGLSQGLHRGVNLLRVTAYRSDGAYGTETRQIVVSRVRPLAGAGPDLRAVGPGRVTLHGAASAVRRGAKLVVSWRIVNRPRGSRARLLRAHSLRPQLIFDVHGRYVVRETVRERGGRGAHAAGALTSSDDADVNVVLDSPMIPIDTMVNTANGANDLSIQGQTEADPSENGSAHLVVFNRLTLQVIGNASYCVSTACTQSGILQEYLASLSSNDLVVLSVPPDNSALPIEGSTAEEEFNQAINEIGGTSLPQYNPQQPYSTAAGFSIIGIPGIPVGQAYENFGLGSTDPSSPAGDIAGELELDSACSVASTDQCAYKFVPRDYVPFSTSAPTTASASITVGSQPPVLITDASGPGFLVAVYDAGTLAPVNHGSFAVDPGGVPSAQAIGQMSSFLGAYSSDPGKLVIIQSFGDPTPGSAAPARIAWGQLSNEIESLHGNRDVFNTLNGTGNYALVGGNGADVPTAEVSQTELYGAGMPAGPGTLEGVLGRDNDYRFHALLADPAPGTDAGTDLLPIAYQPSTPWPDSSGDDELAADYIATQLGGTLAQGWTSVAQMRTAYWNADGIDWGGVAQDTAQTQQGAPVCQIEYPNTKPASWASSSDGGPSVSEFDSVCVNLANELNEVDKVIGRFGPPGKAYLGDIPGAFSNPAGTAVIQADLQTVTTSINAALNPPATDTQVDSGGLAYGALELTAELTGEALAPELGLAMAGLEITNALSDNGSGGSDQVVQTAASSAASTIANNIAESGATLNLLGEVLVSDPAKLAAAAADYGLWDPNTSPGVIGTALLGAATQADYTTILGAIYSGYTYFQSGTTNAADFRCYGTGINGVDIQLFNGEGPDGQMQWLADWDSNGNPIDLTFALTHTVPLGGVNGIGSNTDAPPESVMAKVFAPLASGGGGFLKPQFFEDELPHTQVYCSPDNFGQEHETVQIGPAFPAGGMTYPLFPPYSNPPTGS